HPGGLHQLPSSALSRQRVKRRGQGGEPGAVRARHSERNRRVIVPLSQAGSSPSLCVRTSPASSSTLACPERTPLGVSTSKRYTTSGLVSARRSVNRAPRAGFMEQG